MSAPMLLAVNAAGLALMLVLYLAPSKYVIADQLVAAMLLVLLGVRGLRPSGAMEGVKHLVPLLVMLLYVPTFGAASVAEALPWIKGIMIGLMCYLLLYAIFCNEAVEHRRLLAVGIFLAPGLVYFTLMWLDIFWALFNHKVAFHTNSNFGLLEHIKDVPRVGRRYLSMALMHLLCGAGLLAWYFHHPLIRRVALILFGAGLLSLALLDARAAYLSVILGGMLLFLAVGPQWTMRQLGRITGMGGMTYLLLGGLLLVVAGVGYNAGKSRWNSLEESLAAATHDVFESQVPLSRRPFVDGDFWNSPIEDLGACYREQQFRCRVDQSAYLRIAWLLVGGRSLIDHPLGIGYSPDYLGRLWGVAGQTGKYQRADSFMVEHIVTFGLPGILLYALLVGRLLYSLRRSIRARTASFMHVGVCALILVCIGRALVDVFDEGLWRYLMALLGIYYGLLHPSEIRDRRIQNA
jgi:hypothetical protein